MVGRIGRALPRGYADLFLQLGIWFGFALAYQVARGVADRGASEAFANGRLVLETQRALGALVEPEVQRLVVASGGFLVDAVNTTYWLSQFPVLGLAVLWIYLARNHAFLRVRNWILTTNLLALVGYVVMPTAPPRMFPSQGFVDTLASAASLNHGSALVELASNQHAAMPSIHAANALIIGLAMASLVRTRVARAAWTLWPGWVWFTVVATGNHFWLDIAAGAGVALVAGTLVGALASRRPTATPALATPRRW